MRYTERFNDLFDRYTGNEATDEQIAILFRMVLTNEYDDIVASRIVNSRTALGIKQQFGIILSEPLKTKAVELFKEKIKKILQNNDTNRQPETIN